MSVKIGTVTAPTTGVLVDLYYEDIDGADVTALEDQAIADVSRDYPEHLTRISYMGDAGEIVRIRVYGSTEAVA